MLVLALTLAPSRRTLPVTLEYPHTDINNITCSACHDSPGSIPASYGPYPPWNTDDTPANNLCLSCHNDIEAPFVRTHSSLTTSAQYDAWSIECRTCHEPDEWAGWLVLGNVAHPGLTYRILSNTTDTLTVEGTLDPVRVTPGSTFAIVYGKLIRSTISTPNSGAKTVKFFAAMGGDPRSRTRRCEIHQSSNSTDLAWDWLASPVFGAGRITARRFGKGHGNVDIIRSLARVITMADKARTYVAGALRRRVSHADRTGLPAHRSCRRRPARSSS